ncbi:MAG: hypothetical protein WDZ41_00985 [Candidatus Babeliales bacterium]
MKRKFLSLSLLMVSLLFLPNCDWFKPKPIMEKDEEAVPLRPSGVTSDTNMIKVPNGQVLLTIKGKDVLTVPQFEEYVEEAAKANPQIKQIISFYPDAESELFKTKMNELVIQEWLKDQNVRQRPEYQKDLKQAMDLVEQQLALKYFFEEYPKMQKIEITDAQAKKDYEKRKETSPEEITISRGGVNAQGVMFEKEADAKEFLNKIKEAGANFEKAAKDQKLMIKEFKQVNAQSFDIEAPIREKLLEMKQFPQTQLIKTKDKFWVVQATSKEETQYVPFEQVKDAIKQQLKVNRLFTEELEKLKKQMNVKEHTEYFEKKKKEREKEMEKMQQQMKKQENMQKKAKADTAKASAQAKKANNQQPKKTPPMPAPVKGA